MFKQSNKNKPWVIESYQISVSFKDEAFKLWDQNPSTDPSSSESFGSLTETIGNNSTTNSYVTLSLRQFCADCLYNKFSKNMGKSWGSTNSENAQL